MTSTRRLIHSLDSSAAALVGEGRQAFLQSLSQHARLLAIDTRLAPDALLVEQFHGREAMSEPFRFEVDCVATSATYELKVLIGTEASLRLLLNDGRYRSLHGMVTAMHQLASDGSLARYRLVLAPWLHALTLRRDSYVFQDKTVLEIAAEIFADYPFARYRFDVRTPLPKRSLSIQYRESDHAFLRRLLAEEGLNYFFEHLDPDQQDRHDPSTSASAASRHRLVIFDDNAALQRCLQPTIRFQRAAATETDDTVTLLSQRRQVQANVLALSSWDYKTLSATTADDAVRDELGAVPPLEIHEGSGAYRFTDAGECARIARARAESLQQAQYAIECESTARQLAVGTWFALSGHHVADDEHIVLSITHHAANNLAAGAQDPSERHRAEAGTYRNRFSCVPRTRQVRPPYWFPKPQAPGPQVALVVGIENEQITTDRDHRIKIQFPWQRGDCAASGQAPHPSTSNASGNESIWTWVRVAEPAAGANWGSAFIPRIGQEVCVDFIDGDIDRPLIIGQLYNGADAPPLHGADNHPGALAGIQSAEYRGDGRNRWLIDDSPGQLRQQLHSSYASSQLNLGYLIRQDRNRRGESRGFGFELATDAWASMRAGRGIFASTSQRASARSTQLDSSEAQQKIEAARKLARTLSDAAEAQQAAALATPTLLASMGNAIAAHSRPDGQQAPAFAEPLALFDSASAFTAATPASGVLFGGKDVSLTSVGAFRASAAQAATLVTGKSTSLFSHAGGAKVIAAQQAVSVRTHTGPMQLVAEKALTLTSSGGHIRIQAKHEILLASGGGYIRLSGGDIDIHCPSSLSVKGSSHDFLGAQSKPALLPVLPSTYAHAAGPISEITTQPSLGALLLNDVKAWKADKASAGTAASIAAQQVAQHVTDALLPNHAAAHRHGATSFGDAAAGVAKELWNSGIALTQGLVHAVPLLRAEATLNGTAKALASAPVVIPPEQAYGADAFDKAALFLGAVTGGAEAAEKTVATVTVAQESGPQAEWLRKRDSDGSALSNTTDPVDLNKLENRSLDNLTAPIDFNSHIFSGEIRPNGSVVGGHSIASGNVRIIPGTKSLPNEYGVYEAKIEIPDPENPGQWLKKTNNGGFSTMFPDAWSMERVKSEVNSAYQNRVIVGNKWTGVTPSGVTVQGWLNPKTTVYPVY